MRWHAIQRGTATASVCVVCMRCNHLDRVYSNTCYQYKRTANQSTRTSAFSIQTRKYFDSFTTVWNWRWLKVAVGFYTQRRREERILYTHHCVRATLCIIYCNIFSFISKWRPVTMNQWLFMKFFKIVSIKSQINNLVSTNSQIFNSGALKTTEF